MRLAKGLCFRCNEKLGPGHRCKSSSISLLEITADDTPEGGNAGGDFEGDETTLNLAKISFHAILGNTIKATMKLQGEINERQVLIIVDSGSTHNFMVETIVEELEIPVQTNSIIWRTNWK